MNTSLKMNKTVYCFWREVSLNIRGGYLSFNEFRDNFKKKHRLLFGTRKVETVKIAIPEYTKLLLNTSI